MEKKKQPPRKFYFVYRKKDDKIVAVGNAKECAKQMGRNIMAFYQIVSRARNGKPCRYEVTIEKENGEDYGNTNEE